MRYFKYLHAELKIFKSFLNQKWAIYCALTVHWLHGGLFPLLLPLIHSNLSVLLCFAVYCIWRKAIRNTRCRLSWPTGCCFLLSSLVSPCWGDYCGFDFFHSNFKLLNLLHYILHWLIYLDLSHCFDRLSWPWPCDHWANGSRSAHYRISVSRATVVTTAGPLEVGMLHGKLFLWKWAG